MEEKTDKKKKLRKKDLSPLMIEDILFNELFVDLKNHNLSELIELLNKKGYKESCLPEMLCDYALLIISTYNRTNNMWREYNNKVVEHCDKEND